MHALDAKDRECAELSAALETGGDRLAAGVRESKIVEIARKNRSLTLAVEKEKAEKARLVTELKAARAGSGARGPGGFGANAQNDDGTRRTESQIEKACREVVAEAARAAETASKERSEWRDKAKEATARAERDAGRYATVRAENDRLRVIIKREVGDDKVDFGELDRSLEAAGGWRGRAREIAGLRRKVRTLRERLEAYEDGAVSVTSPSIAPEDSDFESRPGTAATDATTRSRKSGGAVAATRETVLEATARRRRLDEMASRLAETMAEREEAVLKAKAATARKDALERDARGLREKLEVLKRKSKNDDALIDALKNETRQSRAEADAARREASDDAYSAAAAATGRTTASASVGAHAFAGCASVPAAVYRTMARRAETQDAKLREREQQVLQLRAKIASMENDAAEDSERREGRVEGNEQNETGFLSSTTRDIAAAAADVPSDFQDVSQQHQDDIAALIDHAESLERATDSLKGKLAVAEKTQASLRAQLEEARRDAHRLKIQLLRSGGDQSGGDRAGSCGD